MKVQTLQIVGDGPTGTPLWTLDRFGLKDETAGSFASGYQRFNVINPAADCFVWVCLDGVWQVAAVGVAYTVVGGSSATATVVHCAQGVAIGSGTAQLSSAFDLTVTAPSKAFGTLIASPTQFTRGDVLGVNIGGTIGSFAGTISILLKKVG